jgi:hypothetical protein
LNVHPTLPLINEQDFWAMYNAQPAEAMSTGRLSLVVAQAMIFLACPVRSLQKAHEMRCR